MSSDASCKWGIMGCANIAKKNAAAIILASNATLFAVSSRSLSKCEKFCNDNNITPSVKRYGSYEELLQDNDIDAVYIPLPTQLHLEWVTKTAQSKKHILLEKPAAINKNDLVFMLQSCSEHNVQFMDGVMFMHHERLNKMINQIKAPLYGNVVRVDSVFSFNAPEVFFQNNIRTSVLGDPLGALGDLGWYCIRMGLVVYQTLIAVKVKARCHSWTPEGIPLDCDVRVYFDENSEVHKILTFSSSFQLPYRCRVDVFSTGNGSSIGDKVLSCDDFVLTRNSNEVSYTVETYPSSGPLGDNDTLIVGNLTTVRTFDCIQEMKMFETFSELVLTGKRVKYWGDLALATQVILDACLESMKLNGQEVLIDNSIMTSMLCTIL